ncbi:MULTISPECIES: DUF1573 domain-containing protein [Pirellulaceae]|uniref:DUF1573 domain-containing protein n=1 Tax=Aporhodopirellula rubra TaxID=980271 RepID=A0A7W5DVV6_9BACT|nr:MULTISPECIES: DUF1573 domain-containing protein [Pirellulaceae]EMI40788.1 signal peptide protein [Rhodopirellula sp. SWK7]MBB3204632.1 hypothetical protein [Aporhodopirellula rubra]
MKTFIACLVIAAIGIGIGLKINNDRYGHYEPAFGPITFHGDVDASNAMASMASQWSDTFPKVELPNGNVYDFGVMEPEEKGEHIFIVKNVGDDTLKLKVGASTCKCTVGELGTENLEPGEQTEVKMSWTVKTNESSFGQSAELRTNDPSQVAIRFEIQGQVVRQVQIVPEQVTFGETAAGEDVDFVVKVFNYLGQPMRASEVKFGDETIDELAEFDVTTFTPSEDDGVNEAAEQAFRVAVKLKPGLKQGPVNRNMMLTLMPEDAEDDDVSKGRVVYIPVTGRIVGALSMLPNSRLKGVSGGGYMYDFGIVEDEDSMTAKAFVVLKGAEQAATKLSIGEIEPAEFIEASLNEPVGQGKMTLYTLQLKLKPGAKNVERLGMGKGDFGYVMIESDNPKVPALKLLLKFALSAR